MLRPAQATEPGRRADLALEELGAMLADGRAVLALAPPPRVLADGAAAALSAVAPHPAVFADRSATAVLALVALALVVAVVLPLLSPGPPPLQPSALELDDLKLAGLNLAAALAFALHLSLMAHGSFP